MEQGKYIVIEGNDGTGKSTQVKQLAGYLESTHGIESFIAEEPAGTPIADEIRSLIKNGDLERSPETNLLLFTAARREIWQRASRELQLGRWVLSARNYISTLAYQGAGEGIDETLITDITRQFVGDDYMSPDHAIILTLGDSSTRTARIDNRGALEKPDTFESKPSDFQDRVNSAYIEIATKNNYPLIDASQSVDDIQQEIRDIIGLA